MKGYTIKNVLIAMTVSLLINGAVDAADVVCEKRRSRWYPVNKKALIITKYLNVKTCGGDKFQAKVKELGLTTNAPSWYKKSKKSLRKQLGL